MLSVTKRIHGTIETSGSLSEAPAASEEEQLLKLVKPAASSASGATGDLPNVKSPDVDDSPEPLDLDQALVEAAKEISFDWPEFVPVERIIPGTAELALECLFFAGLAALGTYFFSLAS